MENPLYDPDLDHFPPGSPAGPESAPFKKISRPTAPVSKKKQPIGPPGNPGAGRKAGGFAERFANLSLLAITAYSLGLGALIASPIALALKPELRRPLPLYTASVMVALIGTARLRSWASRRSASPDEVVDLVARDYAILSGQDLLQIDMARLFAMGRIYCPPKGTSVLTRTAPTLTEESQRKLLESFPWVHGRARGTVGPPLEEWKALQTSIIQRLLDRGLLSAMNSDPRYTSTLCLLWTAPWLLSGWSCFDLAKSSRNNPDQSHLFLLIFLMMVFHFGLWCRLASNGSGPRKFPCLSQRGREELKRARKDASSLHPASLKSLARLSPEDANLSLSLFGLGAWCQRDPALQELIQRLFPPPPSANP